MALGFKNSHDLGHGTIAIDAFPRGLDIQKQAKKKGRDICDRTAFAWLMGISCHHCWIHTLLIGETQAVSLRSAGPSGGLGHFLFFHSVGSNHPN
jgi:hypothetical protein